MSKSNSLGMLRYTRRWQKDIKKWQRINLEEANTGFSADNQAEEIIEKFVSGSINE